MERSSYGNANVVFVPHGDNGVENTDDWQSEIEKVSKEKKIRCTGCGIGPAVTAFAAGLEKAEVEIRDVSEPLADSL